MHAHARRAAQQALRLAACTPAGSAAPGLGGGGRVCGLGGGGLGGCGASLPAVSVVSACKLAARGVGSCAMPPPPPLPPLAHAFASSLPPAEHAPDALLMAVPKRKTTPSRKGKRSEGKHLRFAPFVSRCHVCNRVKGGPHVLCPHCGPSYVAPAAPAAPDA